MWVKNNTTDLCHTSMLPTISAISLCGRNNNIIWYFIRPMTVFKQVVLPPNLHHWFDQCHFGGDTHSFDNVVPHCFWRIIPEIINISLSTLEWKRETYGTMINQYFHVFQLNVDRLKISESSEGQFYLKVWEKHSLSITTKTDMAALV